MNLKEAVATFPVGTQVRTLTAGLAGEVVRHEVVDLPFIGRRTLVVLKALDSEKILGEFHTNDIAVIP